MKTLFLAIAVAIFSATVQAESAPAPQPGMVQEGKIADGTRYEAIKTLIFSEGDKEIGRLTWDGGEARFVGKADKSAKRFFNDLIKKYLQPALDAQAKAGTK